MLLGHALAPLSGSAHQCGLHADPYVYVMKVVTRLMQA